MTQKNDNQITDSANTDYTVKAEQVNPADSMLVVAILFKGWLVIRSQIFPQQGDLTDQLNALHSAFEEEAKSSNLPLPVGNAKIALQYSIRQAITKLNNDYQLKVRTELENKHRISVDPNSVLAGVPLSSRAPNYMLKYFEYKHLPAHLQEVSKVLCEAAEHMDKTLPESAEKTAGLRKLLEAKDCFVRAALDKPKGE